MFIIGCGLFEESNNNSADTNLCPEMRQIYTELAL